MARLLPLVCPALMSRVQAAIAVSAATFSSLQMDQSSANAGAAKPGAIRSRKTRAARRGMANLWAFHLHSRAFPGKVDTGFPKGNATNIESRALPGHSRSDALIYVIGKRSRSRHDARQLPNFRGACRGGTWLCH